MPPKKKIKKKEGAPLFQGRKEKDIVAKLERAWTVGANDSEAALSADITPSQLCRYLQSHPLVSQRKDTLLHSPKLKAKILAFNKMGTFSEAMEYLKSRDPEFNPTKKTQLSNDPDNPLLIPTPVFKGDWGKV